MIPHEVHILACAMFDVTEPTDLQIRDAYELYNAIRQRSYDLTERSLQ